MQTTLVLSPRLQRLKLLQYSEAPMLSWSRIKTRCGEIQCQVHYDANGSPAMNHAVGHITQVPKTPWRAFNIRPSVCALPGNSWLLKFQIVLAPPPASFWEFLLHIFSEGLSMKIYWNLSGGTHTLWTLMLCNVTEMKSCRYHQILHPILARKVDSKAHALGSSFQVLDVPHPFLWSYCDD